jgi:type IV secretion system protein VirB5
MTRLRVLCLGLLVGTAGIAVPSALSPLLTQAAAQVPVIDNAAIAQLLQQLAEARQQYQEAVSQYQQLRQTYAALAQAVNPNQWAQQLEQPALQNAMPNTTLLPSLLAGISPPSQLGGTLGPLAQQYLNQNQVYLPQGQGVQPTRLRDAANATAEIEAVATQNLQSLQTRAAALPQIQDQLNTATTIQQVASIQARLTAEQNYAQAQTAQAANLQVLATEQQQAQQTAQTEAYRQGLDQGIASECANLARLGASTTGCTP